MSLDDLLNKLLFMAVCDDGEANDYIRDVDVLSAPRRPGVYIPLSPDISPIRESTDDFACYAEADEVA